MVLYQEPAVLCAAKSLLHVKHYLQPGMRLTAYFPEDHDSRALHGRMEGAVYELIHDRSAVQVEFASHCSTVIYITVLGACTGVAVEHLVKALNRSSGSDAPPRIVVEYGPSCFFELHEKGALVAIHFG